MQENMEYLIELPQDRAQERLYAALGYFVDFMERPREASEVLKDKQRSVPAEMLPMLF
ncbi:hypothetical protein PQ465_11355 [Sphingobacterium oryzagri]|uniref:Uncharacterized protein n=1 Tax=Sphingobacterium oryzagri TaxID=3025669 RepID=A0ABY7WBR7_9SPHI|nr:hypothetical protein [Sphingobacterium sp. KACC 22765]WDF66902.1 hypothetical protein PQ465_11355 [Sphingobacterium sp. KACC 22765]